MRKTASKILTADKLRQLAGELKSEGKQVVFTNGCFDLLHVGHIRYLQEARAMGDVLIVALNSDSSVRGLKGESRPINSENERAEIVAALECVDYVTIFQEATPITLLQDLQPPYYVKGGDYTEADLPEAETVIGYGGYVVVLPFEEGHSTSSLIERICSAHETGCGKKFEI
jgi:rfaE bifunctional protein nucleotidyltransferase chain/domain